MLKMEKCVVFNVGDVGYVVFSIKMLFEVKIGDMIMIVSKLVMDMLLGYKEV